MSDTKTVSIPHRTARIVLEVLISFMGAAFLTLFSHIAIPLPFTPIPLTLQTFAVFILGGVLGSRRGCYSVMMYLIQGSFGLPVFAKGAIHCCWFLDPKAGFLLSFIVSAYLIGKMIEARPKVSIFYLLFTLSLGQVVIWTMGMLWLAGYVGFSKAFLFGVLPFFTAASIKIVVGAFFLRIFKN